MEKDPVLLNLCSGLKYVPLVFPSFTGPELNGNPEPSAKFHCVATIVGGAPTRDP